MIAGLRRFFRYEREDLDVEIAFHLDARAADLVRLGLSPEQARQKALADFGDVQRYQTETARIERERAREVRMRELAQSVASDLRFAARTLRRAPGFTVVAVLTLALGIGATIAIFSVIYGVLLKPLPFPESDRLVAMWHRAPELGFDQFQQSPATYLTYRRENRVFEDVGVWIPFPDVSITGRGEPERVQTLYVSDGTLATLKVQPLLGRRFTTADDAPGSPDRMILTYGFWQRRFGGTRDIVGQTITVDGKSHEVIGVLPPSFRFLDRNPAVLLPLRLNPAGANLGGFSYNALARLKPGVTIEEANDDVARMIPLAWERFPPQAGEQKIRLKPNVRPMSDDVVGRVGRLLWILLGAVGIVLLIACANVANLFLVRAEGRRRELALRSALGASRGRLARGLLTECMMLGLAGGLAGLVLARSGIALLVRLAPTGLPRVEEIGVHPVVLVFTLVIAIVAGLLFGLLAVLKSASPSMTELEEGGRGASDGRERHRTRDTLVVAQVALALLLLVVSALMVRTFIALRHVDPGFTRPEHVQTLRIAIPQSLVSDPQQIVQTHRQIAERLRALPGVQSVGLGSSITMDGIYFNGSILVEEFPETRAGQRPFRRHKFIAPGYFETLGSRVLIGRTITWRDIDEDALVAVVSAKLAREYWEDPAQGMGKRIRVSATQPWREIVGIVGNELDDGLNRAPPAIVYWPMAMKRFLDEPFVMPTMSYAVRSDRIHSPGFVRELERAVWSVNPNLPLANIRTLDDIRAQSMSQTSFALTMLVIAAAMSLLLAIVGLYGVIAYIAAQRTREIGIRIALGAQSGDVRKLFLRHGLSLTITGIACGVGVTLVLSRVMRALLFGVSHMDPMAYAVVSGVLAAVMLLAMYLPARRASSVDPVIALREEA